MAIHLFPPLPFLLLPTNHAASPPIALGEILLAVQDEILLAALEQVLPELALPLVLVALIGPHQVTCHHQLATQHALPLPAHLIVAIAPYDFVVSAKSVKLVPHLVAIVADQIQAIFLVQFLLIVATGIPILIEFLVPLLPLVAVVLLSLVGVLLPLVFAPLPLVEYYVMPFLAQFGLLAPDFGLQHLMA